MSLLTIPKVSGDKYKSCFEKIVSLSRLEKDYAKAKTDQERLSFIEKAFIELKSSGQDNAPESYQTLIALKTGDWNARKEKIIIRKLRYIPIVVSGVLGALCPLALHPLFSNHRRVVIVSISISMLALNILAGILHYYSSENDLREPKNVQQSICLEQLVQDAGGNIAEISSGKSDLTSIAGKVYTVASTAFGVSRVVMGAYGMGSALGFW